MTIENLDTHAVIKWRLTDICNYKCPYCIREPLARPYESDEQRCIDAIPYVRDLAKALHKNTNKNVKIDLIGGEITIFNRLKEIINGLLEESCIEKINITTNFSNDKLFDIASDKLTITVSYHPSQTTESLESFISRVLKIKPLVKFIKCETVATYEATHIEKFVELCKQNNLDYQVEEDLRDERCKGKSCSSKKPSPRYRVTDDKGITKLFNTRNEFLKKYGIEGFSLDLRGHLCSRDFDYLYIEQDNVMYCFGQQHVSKASVANSPHPCHRDNKRCTLCGNISIYPIPRSTFYFD